MTDETDSGDASLSQPALERIDRVCLEFEDAWKQGNPPRIEDYLGEVQGPERSELLRELLLLDLDYRVRSGDQPTQEEYQTRFRDDDKLVADVFGQFSIRVDSYSPPGTKLRYFGDYELLEELGHGGMGIVYKARQTTLNRIVAIKMIRASEFVGEQEIRRFLVEAEAVANLDHPNIVPLYEVGQHEGQHYFSMAYVDGQSLADVVRNQLPATRTAAEYVKIAAEAIHHAHHQGVLHRDIKPGNVLIDRSGQIRITDFGLAKRLDSDSDLTSDLQVLGTPEYMPPEQALGRHDQIGPAADVYSLGALLYALLIGQPPFHAATRVATLAQVVEMDPTPPQQINPEIDRDLETITLKCLEKDPTHRFADAKELVDELQRFLDGTPILSRPLSEREWIERCATKAGYAILDELGRNENGVMFSARQVSLERTVALKVFDSPKTEVHPAEEIKLSNGDTVHLGRPNTNIAKEHRRFLKMAKRISRLQHPNIATVYDFGRFGERPFLVMELVDGGSLLDKVAHSQTERVQAVEQVISVAHAIDFANRAGVMHGYLTPASVLLTADGTPKIADFPTLSDVGLLVSAFAAPELCWPFSNSKSSIYRIDVYGLGATLYYLLTGCPPFEGATSAQTISLVVNVEPVAPRERWPFIDRDLEAICLKCLEKDPNRRYGSASELAADLGRYLRGQSTLARGTSLLNRVYLWCKRRYMPSLVRQTNQRRGGTGGNRNHLKIVKNGEDAIHVWRQKNPAVQLDLGGVDLSSASLNGANLSRANLSEAYLDRANLNGANLSRANLSEAHLFIANLSEANLSGAFFFDADLGQANLSEANLSEANLIRANLSAADLSGADLSSARLNVASFNRANLSGANLSAADLSEANLSRANLSGANLSGTNLSGANLSAANLSGAKLMGAKTGWTVFGDVDFSGAKNLEAVLHEGPSTVGVDTLIRNEGRIPDEFLRGCGFTPWQILNAKLHNPALTAPEISELQHKILGLRARCHSYIGGVFISYSDTDAKFVDHVYDQLQEQGASVWLHRHEMAEDPAMWGIRGNDVVLLVLSEASVRSVWVENVLEMARHKEENENRDVLCPVALDESWKERAFDEECPRPELWRTLAQKNVLDFSKWKTKAFGLQFEQLVRVMARRFSP